MSGSGSKDNTRKIYGAGAVMGASASVSAVLRLRHNMAVQHFQAAAYFSNRVRDLENRYAGEGWGPHAVEMQWNFASCVMISAASLDAYFNETVENMGFDRDFLRLIEREAVLDRYLLLLKLTKKEPFDKGRQPAQNIHALSQLRNAFVHFRPQWDDAQGKSQQLEQLLPRRPTNNFCGDSEMFFPRRCISSGYSEWAVESVHSFIDDFSKRMGEDFRLPPRSKWGEMR